MSERQDNNDSEEESPVPEAPTPAITVSDESRPEAEASPAPAAPAAAPARRGSGAVAWLALLLVLALSGAAAWSLYEAQQREAALLSRLSSLEDDSHPTAADGATQARQVEQRVQQRLAEIEPKLVAQARQVEQLENRLRQVSKAGNTDALASRLTEQSRVLQELRQQLASQGDTLERLPAIDRHDWLLAEAEYLLRLANQRLLMTGDVASAEALLASADGVLRELDDVSLHQVRQELAADIATLRALPRVDVQGLYLRLAALLDQVGKLVIFELPEAEEQVVPEPAGDWQVRLQRGYEEALDKLSDYVIIRRREVPVEALVDPQWEGLVRQNLQMLLEQAQVALLSGNQVLYRESLGRARHWVAQFFVSDERTAAAMDSELEALMGQAVSTELPDISGAMQALDRAVSRRRQRMDDN